MGPVFRDRSEGGRAVAGHLRAYADRPDVLVLALPRGGVPIGYEVARMLRAPLDVFVVRKLGVPGHEELALGAIASGGTRVLNQEIVGMFQFSGGIIDAIADREQRELERRERAYRGDRPAPVIEGRVVILVDDGLATGATMLAAVRAVRQRGPSRVIVAVPVAARASCDDLRREADEIVCAATPEPFYAVSAWYENFSETTDEEVRRLLEEAATQQPSAP